MSLNNFIPQVWSARVLATLDDALVYNQDGVVNRDHEGEISGFGDTVKINSLGRVTVKSYTKNTDIDDPEVLTSAQQDLIVDQASYFNFQVDDVDKAQTQPKVMGQAMNDSGYELAASADTYTAGIMAAAAVASSNKIGTVASPKADLGTPANAYQYLVDLGVLLDEANTPSESRFCIAPSWFIGVLAKDGTYIVNATETGQQVRMNGMIGMVAGFRLMMSNRVPNTTSSTGFRIVAGHRIATSYAEQILDVKAYEPEKRFSEAVKGLHVYGAKVVRPSNLAVLIANRPS